jgi:hypothetical protein
MQTAVARPRWLEVVMTLVLPSVTALGCAHRAGQKATRGAVEELQRSTQERRQLGEPAFMEQAAGNAVIGTMNALDDPARQEQLARIVGTATQSAFNTAMGSFRQPGAWGGGPRAAYGAPIGAFGNDFSAGFALGMSRQLQVELGPDGSGPLGKSLSGLAQEMSGAVASGVVAELSPVEKDCAGPDRKGCVDRRVYDMSRVAAIGFADGVAHSLRIPVLVLTFLGGFVVALIATSAFRRRSDGPVVRTRERSS